MEMVAMECLLWIQLLRRVSMETLTTLHSAVTMGAWDSMGGGHGCMPWACSLISWDMSA